jgi:hypothetical protein
VGHLGRHHNIRSWNWCLYDNLFQLTLKFASCPYLSHYQKYDVLFRICWAIWKFLWHRRRYGSRVVHCRNIIRSGAGLQFLDINNFFTCIWTILWHTANLLTFFFVIDTEICILPVPVTLSKIWHFVPNLLGFFVVPVNNYRISCKLAYNPFSIIQKHISE